MLKAKCDWICSSSSFRTASPSHRAIGVCSGTICSSLHHGRFVCAAKERRSGFCRFGETVDALHRLRGMSRGAEQQYVFLNHEAQPLTRDGVAYILAKHSTAVAQDHPAWHANTSRPTCCAILRGRAAAIRYRCDRDPRLSWARQHRHDRTLSHDQPEDEARRNADILEARRDRAFAHQVPETEAGPPRVSSGALTPWMVWTCARPFRQCQPAHKTMNIS